MTEAVLQNLKVSVKNGKACERIISVEVPAENIEKEYDLFYQAVAIQARIPGFRPGKAPRNILELHYKGEAEDRVVKNLISDSFKAALSQTALVPLIYPKIQDVEFKANRLSYKALIEVRPKIKISRIKGLLAKKESAEVKPEEIENELKHIQESLAQFKVVENRPAELGDFVIADYVCTSNGVEVDKRNDDWLEIKKEGFIKELAEHLIGLNPGDEKDFEVTFPQNFARKELAGKVAQFHVKVKEIKTKSLPPLNDELAKEAGEFNTLAELRLKVEKDLIEHRQKEKEAAYENGLLEELIKQNKIDLPEGLVAKRLEHLLDEAKHTMLRQGASEADFESEKEKLSENFAKEAAREVHLAFLLDEIGLQEHIQVTEADRKQKYEELATRLRQPLEKIESFYSGNENARESLNEQILNQKVIEFIKQNAKTKN